MSEKANINTQSASSELIPGPYITVVATGFGVFLSALDSSKLNVSLVTMAENLGVEMTAIQWVVLSYLIIYTASMPLMGKIGDRYGRTRTFQIGMVVFITGSFFCAISPILELLVTSRVIQAVGASMMGANGLALVTYFTSPENRGRAIGLNSVILAAALALGPVLGGFLSELFGWPSIFLVNLPVGFIGLIITALVIPPTERVYETSFDTLGASLFFIFLFSLVFTASISSEVDFAVIGLLLIITSTCLLAFIVQEKRHQSPMIRIGVLSDRRIAAGIFSALFSYMTIIPFTYWISIFFQVALGYTPSMTGLFMATYPIAVAVVGPVAGLISERIRARTQTATGIFIQLSGLLMLGIVIPNIPLMVIAVVIMATGMSLFTVANGNFVMTTAPSDCIGVVSALLNISRTTGFSVATALATAMFTLYFQIISQGAGSVLGFVGIYTLSVSYVIFSFCIFGVLAIIISASRGLSPAEEGGPESLIACDE